ncbi:MAG: DMT family transporter [Wenzhouxiangella sp.]|nr:MAG: DMT family transporter [Wenzhouxiangella sp.]
MTESLAATLKIVLLTILALCAFAANSILARLALTATEIDPVSFTGVRLVSGALMLWLIVRLRQPSTTGNGNWASALALFAYAIAFSLAYLSLTAATGALILFGAVQATMVGWALVRGDRLGLGQWIGLALALAGLVGLLLPGLHAPPLPAAGMMLAAGVAWGIYSLRGRGPGDPISTTATNFALACVPAVAVTVLFLGQSSWDIPGLLLAIASGALASGLGYVVWYSVLGHIQTSTAAVAQLSVPAITALAGVVLLTEPISLRLLLAGLAILGGIALVSLGSSSKNLPLANRKIR